MTARVHSIDLSRWGLPKNAAQSAFVGFEGLEGRRWCARVLREHLVTVGDEVRVAEAP